MTDLERQWYWDRRTNEAYFPVETDDDAVRLTSVWHREEFEDALETGAVVPLSAVGLDRTETTFDLLDSFRLPADVADE